MTVKFWWGGLPGASLAYCGSYEPLYRTLPRTWLVLIDEQLDAPFAPPQENMPMAIATSVEPVREFYPEERLERKGRAGGTECTYGAVNLDGDVAPWLDLSEVRGRTDLDALRERRGNQGSERDEVLHDVGIVWRLS